MLSRQLPKAAIGERFEEVRPIDVGLVIPLSLEGKNRFGACVNRTVVVLRGPGGKTFPVEHQYAHTLRLSGLLFKGNAAKSKSAEIENAHAAAVPSHPHLPTDILRRRFVKGSLDLHKAVPAHVAPGLLIAKRPEPSSLRPSAATSSAAS
jgi:hypothetical protein